MPTKFIKNIIRRAVEKHLCIIVKRISLEFKADSFFCSSMLRWRFRVKLELEKRTHLTQNTQFCPIILSAMF